MAAAASGTAGDWVRRHLAAATEAADLKAREGENVSSHVYGRRLFLG